MLLDVVPLSIGIEHPKGVFHQIIPRNSFIPTKKSTTIRVPSNFVLKVSINPSLDLITLLSIIIIIQRYRSMKEQART